MQAGLQGIELDNVTSQHGLHYRIGHASSNGIAGFTLGMCAMQPLGAGCLPRATAQPVPKRLLATLPVCPFQVPVMM